MNSIKIKSLGITPHHLWDYDKSKVILLKTILSKQSN